MLFPLLGAFLIGLSKAGFATGIGMLTTPLLASAMPAREAIGVVLPLLCAADLMTVAVFWRKWDAALVKLPLAGAALGIAGGMLFVNAISDRALSLSIGVVGLVLVAMLVARRLRFPEHVYRPRWWAAVAVGIAAGFSSTIAHAAGPIIAGYLLAQKPDKHVFVASSAIFFTVNNLMKVPPYVASGLITFDTLRADLFYLPMIPLGVLAGWLVHRWLPQRRFDVVVYVLLFVTSLQLVVANAR